MYGANLTQASDRDGAIHAKLVDPRTGTGAVAKIWHTDLASTTPAKVAEQLRAEVARAWLPGPRSHASRALPHLTQHLQETTR